MGILDRLFKSQRDIAKEEIKTGLPWDFLESVDQFHNVLQNSSKMPKIIFKHSTRCGISRMVLKNFENGYTLKGGEAGFYLLDLLSHRDVSNAIAEELNLTHQSPQVVVIKDQKIIHTDSHHGIDIHKVEQIILQNR